MLCAVSASAIPREADLCVIGAGLVGLATARELTRRHPDARVQVLEREEGPARQQSGHSSGVIHAGIYYAPGSLKARLCAQGAAALYELCAERGVAARREGKLVVATTPGEIGRLDELERRARANGVPGVARLGPQELREVEPHAAGLAALHSPSTGVTDFGHVAEVLAEDLRAARAGVSYGCTVTGVRAGERGVEVAHAGGHLRARRVVVCAGPWADRLAQGAGGGAEPRIVPFRGSYLRLRPGRAGLVRASIYPVPDPALPFLGAHLTRTVTGEVLAGPTALLAGARDARQRLPCATDLRSNLSWPGTWRLLRRHWRHGAGELARSVSRRAFAAWCRRLVPELRPDDFERSPHSGVRAQAVGRDGRLVDDFVVERTGDVVHVRNAPSPAATACLALAAEIADLLDAPAR